MATAAVVARILTQYSDKGSKAAQKDIARLEKKIAAFGNKALKSFAVASAAAGAFAVKIGMDAVKGAAADEKAQTSLAIAIRNSTSATEEAIAANTKFLDQLELQVAVDNDELIPALQKLTIATGDLSQAQNLLVLSTDVAVASGKDLGAVSTAISKAVNGQFGALTKLGLPIDETALKQKDLNKILSDFAEISKGQASAAANTYSGRLKVLALSYNQVIDKLGYALMPLVLEFTEYLTAPGGLIDALDEWIETNETQLQESLKGITVFMQLLIDNGDNLTRVLDLLVTVTKFLDTSILGVIRVFETLLGLFVLGKLIKFAQGLGVVSKEFTIFGKRYDVVSKKAAKAAESTAKVGQGFTTTGATKSTNIITRGLNKLGTRGKIVAGILAVVGAIGSFKAKDFFAGKNDIELLKKMQAQTEKDFKLEKARADQKKNDQILYNNELKIEIARQKIAADAEKKRAAQAKKDAAAQAAIAKGQAALKKFGIKTSEADPIQLEAARLNLVKQGNLAEAARIALILKSKDSVVDLAKAWGGTKEQIEMYGDFVKYLNDGKLSDAEIVKLQEKWGLTSKEVRIYSDIITKASDKVLSDAEIIALGTTWGLTTKEVLDYIKKIGQPVVFSGTLIDPATLAAIGWTDALNALLAYQAALTGKGTPGSSTSSATPSDVAAAAAKAAAAANASASKAAAESYAVAKAAGDSVAAAKAAAGVTPSALAAGESGAIGAASIAAQLRAAEQAQAERSALLALEKQRQQNAIKAQALEDRYGGFAGSSTISNAASMGTGGSSGAVTVNLTVNGSVTTEQDLVQTIRNQLLAGQYNGKQIILQAI